MPENYIDATREVDFARSLAMQNSGFVRTIIGYQEDFGTFWSGVIQDLYKNEFIDTTDAKKRKKKNVVLIDVENIEVNFPTPIYLALSTLNEQISNITQTVDFITNLYYGEQSSDEDDKTYEDRKLAFRKEVTKTYLATSMDWNKFDEIEKQVKENFTRAGLESALDKESNPSEEDDSY